MAVKLNITPGEWKRQTTHNGGSSSPVEEVEVSTRGEFVNGVSHVRVIHRSYVDGNVEELMDNAALIADAGNTYRLTGKLPSELAALAGFPAQKK